jgi:hypothetical protein
MSDDDDILVNDGIIANSKPYNEHVCIDDEVEYLTHGKSGLLILRAVTLSVMKSTRRGWSSWERSFATHTSFSL